MACNLDLSEAELAKPEWGIKRICQACGIRFYDFQKSPIVCPKCATPFDPEAVLKSRRARAIPVDDLPKKKAVVEDVEDEEEVEGLDGDEEALIEEDEEEVVEDEIEEVEDEIIPDVEGDEAELEDDELLEDTSDLDDEDEMGALGADDDEER